MKNKTAVKWLAQRLERFGNLDQAKEKEKDQIIKSFDEWQNPNQTVGNGKTYYKQKYEL